MEIKRCFKCGCEKPLSEFYKHKKMADGHLNKCKDCTKNDVKKNYEKNIEDECYVEKERARGREKYHRLYAQKHIKSSHNENKNTRNFLKNRGIEVEGIEIHHWNYNMNKNVFLLTPRQHKKIHQGLKYDERSKCFWAGDILLDTITKHSDYIKSVIGQKFVHIDF